MANVFTGDDHVFNALIYGEMRPSTRRFLERHNAEAFDDHGTKSRFLDRSRQLYDAFHNGEIASRTRAAIRKIKHSFVRDDIRPLETIGELQQAKSQMRRIIMSDPIVRELHQRQRIEGYEGHYTDVFADRETEYLPEYQQVMTGRFEITEEGDTQVTMYLDAEHDLHEHISLDDEQRDECYQTWMNVRAHLRRGKEDPTSTVNAHL